MKRKTRVIEVNTKTAGKLVLICKALNHTTMGLGEQVNLLSKVWYGVGGVLMSKVKEQLGVI